MNFTTTLYRVFAWNVMVVAAVAMVVFVSPRDESATRPIAEGSAMHLIHKHDCWVGGAPEGVEPTGAVVTEHNVTRYVTGRKVNEALSVALFGAESEIQTVHGFCA